MFDDWSDRINNLQDKAIEQQRMKKVDKRDDDISFLLQPSWHRPFKRAYLFLLIIILLFTTLVDIISFPIQWVVSGNGLFFMEKIRININNYCKHNRFKFEIIK